MNIKVFSLLRLNDLQFLFQTPLEYEREYLNLTHHTSRYHGYAYDGVWAAALAIQVNFFNLL